MPLHRTPFYAGNLYVDNFFLMSGFLMAYNLIKEESNQRESFYLRNVLKRFLHRYLRLTPSVLLMMALSKVLDILKNRKNTCQAPWYMEILYATNILRLIYDPHFPQVRYANMLARSSI